MDRAVWATFVAPPAEVDAVPPRFIEPEFPVLARELAEPPSWLEPNIPLVVVPL
jgi:hypothetical protein